jgi:Yip1 domain
MRDVSLIQQNKRLNFSWIPELLFHPRRCFQNLASITNPYWLTPLLILSIAVSVNIFIVGHIKSQAALMGEMTYPPDFQYYTPEQQVQYTQAIQSTQGPVFLYVLPIFAALFRVWIGWLILGGLLHLTSTLFGGRGSTTLSLNIVAWASLPLAIREFVQIIYLLVTKRIINYPGLSGFSQVVDSGLPLYLNQVLALIDIYLLWQIMLLIIGIRISMGLTPIKSIFSVILSVLIILLIQSGISYLGSVLGNLNITRPFFF